MMTKETEANCLSLDIQALAETLQKQGEQGQFSEKILVVQRRGQGRRILQSLTKAGITLLNVSVETPLSLATSLYQENPKHQGEIISSTMAEHMIFTLLQQEKKGFLAEHQVQSTAAAKALFRTFMDLTQANLRKKPRFPATSLESSTMKLWKAYQSAKESQNRLDQGDLLLEGLAQSEGKERWAGVTFFTLESDYFSPLEWSFLQSCTTQPMNQFRFPEEEAITALGSKDCRFISCRGQETEVRQLFRDILSQNHPVEDCAVVYLDPTYPSLLYQIGPRWGIPVSVGLQLDESQLANTLSKLHEFTLGNFPVEILHHLLKTGACKVNDRKLLAKRLENRHLTFGRALYHCDFQLDSPGLNPNEEQIELFERQTQQNADTWAEFFHCILTMGDETLPVAEQKNSIRTFLANFSPLHGVGERVAYLAMLNLLDHVAQVCGQECLLARFLQAIQEQVYAPYSGEETALLCLPLAEAVLSGKKHLYVLGLTRYSLENGGRQSPILLDHARVRFEPALETVATRGARYGKSFQYLIQGHEGDFVFLYPNFDSTDMVKLSPAPFYEEALALRQGQEESVDYVSQQVLSPGDLALTQAWSQSDYPLPVLEQQTLTETDLASLMKKFVFSASSFEEALHCPMAFYLKRILRLKVASLELPRENQWIPANERGTFVHDVLDQYYTCHIKGETVDLDQLFEAQFLLLEDKNPCQPDDLQKVRTKEKEKLDLRQWVENAIDWTSQQAKREVLSTELVFGHDMPLALKVGDREILLRGTIDRVDKVGDKIHILDYKTGRVRSFLQKDHLQHYLYALAYEAEYSKETVSSAGYLMLNPSAELVDYPDTGKKAVRQKMAQKIAALLDILSDETKIQTPCPCYDFDPSSNTLVVGSSTTRREAYEGCKKYCDYKDFCQEKMEVIV